MNFKDIEEIVDSISDNARIEHCEKMSIYFEDDEDYNYCYEMIVPRKAIQSIKWDGGENDLPNLILVDIQKANAKSL